MREASDVRPIDSDGEDLPVRLVVVGIGDGFRRHRPVVRREHQALGVGAEPGVVRPSPAPAVHHPPQPSAVWVHHVDGEAPAARVVPVRGEGNPLAVRRPVAHGVAPGPLGQPVDPRALALHRVHDVQILVPGAPRAEDHPFAVGGRGRERVVRAPRRQLLDRWLCIPSIVVVFVGQRDGNDVHLGTLGSEVGAIASVDGPLPLPVPRRRESDARENLPRPA